MELLTLNAASNNASVNNSERNKAPTNLGTLELPPLSAYVHIPWCKKKCHYCDFNSHETKGAIPEAAYVDALIRDLQFDSAYAQGRKLEAVFFGGGTPSLFSAHGIGRILNALQTKIGFSPHCEITLEANPGTAEAGNFKGYLQAGVNRLSLGVQSFSDTQLQNLSRIHSAQEARNALNMAFEAGFSNINIDIMYGLTGQSVDQALDDLQQAFTFNPTHMSWYQLTIEPNTHYYSKPPTLPVDNALEDIQDAGLALLEDSGYQRYEVSAFAQQDRQSRHNMNYWSFADYIGIGAGAHGKLTLPSDDKILRLRKPKQPKAYMACEVNFVSEHIEVDRQDRALEFLMNALRLSQGFRPDDYERYTGLPFSTIAKKVEYLTEQQLLKQTGSHITCSDRGYQLLNSVLQEFL